MIGNEKQKILEEFTNFCKMNGIKRTAQRFTIFESLYCNNSHPTVDEIFRLVQKKSPMIKPESVYRILADFQKSGLISKLSYPTLMRYDCNRYPHSHFICRTCGKIYDIPSPNIKIPKTVEGSTDISITLNGICPKCSKK